MEFQDELSAYEAGESFVQTLIMNLETLLTSFKDILSANNYDQFIQVLTSEVTQRLEKVVMKSQFNRVSWFYERSTTVIILTVKVSDFVWQLVSVN